MDFNAFIIIYIIAFVARIFAYVVVFSRIKPERGNVVGFYLVLIGSIFTLGLILNGLLMVNVTGSFPAVVNKVIVSIMGAVGLEILLLYMGRRFRGRMRPVPSMMDDEDKLTNRYVCDDGHVVKSRGEAMIDNWLYHQNIRHEYEGTVSLGGHVVKYDWYLPGNDVLVEYWGLMNNEHYRQRRVEKESLYRKHGKKLVSISNGDLEDVKVHVRDKLLEFLDESDFTHPKICFNCGVRLDDRYS
ncbi:MAG: hypothetical protein ACTSUE_07455 [Promethearchaeota archaeon]